MKRQPVSSLVATSGMRKRGGELKRVNMGFGEIE